MVNLDKIVICFSKNVREVEKVKISSLLSQRQRNDMYMYLGLPIVVERSKRKDARVIKKESRKKIKGWKGKSS